jgi:hypothetical protein
MITVQPNISHNSTEILRLEQSHATAYSKKNKLARPKYRVHVVAKADANPM